MTLEYTRVEVEVNDNSPMFASQVYKNAGAAFAVTSVRIYDGTPGGRMYSVTGWSSESGGCACEAYAVRIEDSSEGVAVLIYGGDWGVRLRPEHSDAAWSIEDEEQWGETHLVLADEDDIITKQA